MQAAAIGNVRTGKLRHSGPTIALHWASVAFILLAASTVLMRELIEERQLRLILMQWHRELGLLVLLALIARLLVRLHLGMARTHEAMPAPLRWLAEAAHWVLYALILVIPVLGWSLSNAHGVQLTLLGIMPLPALVAPDPDLADTLSDWHVLACWVLLALVVAHVGAALFHHFVRRDQVLSAMLPEPLAEATGQGALEAAR
jgi:cytochrome b561